MELEDYHFLFGARPIFGGCWLLVAGRDYLTWEFKAYPCLIRAIFAGKHLGTQDLHSPKTNSKLATENRPKR